LNGRISPVTEPAYMEAFLRGVDAMNRGDAEALLELVDDRTVFEPLRAATEGAFVGAEGMRRFAADTAETFALFKVRYTDVRDLGDGRLLALGTIRMRGRESGVEQDVVSAAIVEYRDDGMLARYKDYGDCRLALQAAGLRS
jgi:ketosteroid isomerase-like protein